MSARLASISLTAKVVTLLATVLVVLLGLNWNTYTNSQKNEDATALVEHTHVVIEHAEKALVGLLEMESGYRGFLTTGSDQHLDQYNAGIEHFEHEIADLEARTADEPEQVEIWQHLAVLGEQWRAEIAEPGILLRRTVDAGAATMQDVVDHQIGATESGLITEIEAELHHGIELEEALLVERAAEQASATSALQGALLWGTLATVLLLAGGGAIVVRVVRADARKQKADADAAKRLAQIVDNSDLGMMSTDADGIVEYMNPELENLLRRIEADLPNGIRVDDIIGSNIDRFHHNPAHNRSMLENLPHTATVTLGATSVELLVQQLVVGGDHVGYLTSWRDVTEQVAAARREEAALRRTQDMLGIVLEKAAQLKGSSETLTTISNDLAGGAEETASQAASV